MPTVDESLAAWAASAQDEELDQGPTLDDLGGYDAVLGEASVLAHGPQLPYLLGALSQSFMSLSKDQVNELASPFGAGLRQPHAGWVLAESVDAVLSAPAVLDILNPDLGSILMDLAAEALGGRAATDLAYPAISGLLQLAVAGRYNRFSLLALLTGITGGEPVDALDHLPLLIGVAHDQFGVPDLLSTLTKLESLDTLPASARVDSSFELALGTLRAALDAASRDDVIRLMGDAAMRLRSVTERQEARVDAEAYACAVEAALIFASNDSIAADNQQIRLGAVAQRLSEAVAKRHAWSSRMTQPSWLEARGHTEAAWAQLTSMLVSATARLAEPSWLEATGVLTSILDIYKATRAVHATVQSNGDSLAKIISPAIEASFIRRTGLLHHLRMAVEEGAALADSSDAVRLLHAIDDKLANLGVGHGGDVPGKGTAGATRLDSLGIASGGIDADLAARLDQTIEDYERGFSLSGNAQMDRQLQDLHKVLSRSSAWQPPTSQHFFSLVDQLLRFLHSRFDAQADLLTARTAYLGPPDSGKKWLEQHVQDDFYEHLIGVFPPGTIFRESIDVASGRTDIIYLPGPGMRFVIEVKRELDNSEHASMERRYIPQAANYTATGPPFGILLVGDHTDHRSGYSDLDDRLWVAQRSRSATETPRLIVIASLPIGRPTPSALRPSR